MDGKETKGKENKSQSKVESSQGGNKKDLSIIKCFHYHEFGHYATKFPHKKARNMNVGGATGEALASQFELDFTLIACMTNTVMGSVWYLNNGASFHMTRNKYFFSDLEEKDLHMHINMGDDGRYNVTTIDTFTFQRESGSPLRLKDVMYVLGLKKNIVSIVVLEDRGYDVIFRKRKAFLIHISMGQVKNTGVQVKNLYKLDVEDYASLYPTNMPNFIVSSRFFLASLDT